MVCEYVDVYTCVNSIPTEFTLKYSFKISASIVRRLHYHKIQRIQNVSLYNKLPSSLYYQSHHCTFTVFFPLLIHGALLSEVLHRSPKWKTGETKLLWWVAQVAMYGTPPPPPYLIIEQHERTLLEEIFVRGNGKKTKNTELT